MKALLYCCKNKPYINNRGNDITDYPDYVFDCEGINGSIPCDCDYEVEEIKLNEYEYEDFNNSPYWYSFFETQTLKGEELHKQSCLTYDELDEYLDIYKEKEVYGYAIHIKNLDIWNTPRSLERMGIKSPIKNITKALALRIAGFTLERYIIIPVRPELMCKILNGECAIIIKKRVPKELR